MTNQVLAPNIQRVTARSRININMQLVPLNRTEQYVAKLI